jgi:hypothetical protein
LTTKIIPFPRYNPNGKREKQRKREKEEKRRKVKKEGRRGDGGRKGKEKGNLNGSENVYSNLSSTKQSCILEALDMYLVTG